MTGVALEIATSQTFDGLRATCGASAAGCSPRAAQQRSTTSTRRRRACSSRRRSRRRPRSPPRCSKSAASRALRPGGCIRAVTTRAPRAPTRGNPRRRAGPADAHTLGMRLLTALPLAVVMAGCYDARALDGHPALDAPVTPPRRGDAAPASDDGGGSCGPDGTVCAPTTNPCQLAGRCLDGVCGAVANAPAGTPCGAAPDACHAAPLCDGAGVCAAPAARPDGAGANPAQPLVRCCQGAPDAHGLAGQLRRVRPQLQRPRLPADARRPVLLRLLARRRLLVGLLQPRLRRALGLRSRELRQRTTGRVPPATRPTATGDPNGPNYCHY